MPSQYNEMSEVPSAGDEDIFQFFINLSISEDEAKIIIRRRKAGILSVIQKLETVHSPSFNLILSTFLEASFDGMITKNRFSEISKNFSLWAAYQKQAKQAGQKNADEEELLFSLPIRELVAGKSSEEGRFTNYLIKTLKTFKEETKKAKNRNALSTLMTANEHHVAKMLDNYFSSTKSISQLKWNIALYLANQLNDVELSEFILSFPLSDEEKSITAHNLAASLTYANLIRELWMVGKFIPVMDLIKNIGSKGFSDEREVERFCDNNELEQFFSEIKSNAEKKVEAIFSGSLLTNEQLNSAQLFTSEIRKLLEAKADSEKKRMLFYEKAYQSASCFYDNSLYELGEERTHTRYGERKEFVKVGVKIYLK